MSISERIFVGQIIQKVQMQAEAYQKLGTQRNVI